jgi:hypothetical protein
MEKTKPRPALSNAFMFRIYPSYLKIKRVGIIMTQLNKRKSDSHGMCQDGLVFGQGVMPSWHF